MKDDGGSAFPVLHSIDGNWVREPLEKYTGMSLRDWFAGQALAGLSSCEQLMVSVRKAGDDPGVVLATTAYVLADAMMEARKK